jgi:hypothetical protein
LAIIVCRTIGRGTRVERIFATRTSKGKLGNNNSNGSVLIAILFHLELWRFEIRIELIDWVMTYEKKNCSHLIWNRSMLYIMPDFF